MAPGSWGAPPPPYGPPPYAPPPPGQDDTAWALAGYLGQLAFGIIAPIVVYAAGRRRTPFTRHHGAQALNASLSQLIAFCCCFGLALGGGLTRTPVGIAVAVAAILAIVVFSVTGVVYLVVATVRAGRREMYRMPAWICWRLVR